MRDMINAAKSNMGITLDQSDTIHKDFNERWGKPPKVEVDKNVRTEVDQG